MKPYPAMAILEYEDISTGMHTVDQVIKKAPIGTLRHGTVSGGHYLVVFTGSTASVEESFTLATDSVTPLDSTLLPDVDHQLYTSITNATRQAATGNAILIVESPTVASLAEAAEQTLKKTDIDLIEFRMADPDLHGKSLITLHGELADIQEAARISEESFEKKSRTFRHQILTAPHQDFTRGINHATSFGAATTLDLEGE